MKDKRISNQFHRNRLIWVLFSLVVILFFIVPIRYLCSYVTFPFPLEYREGASLVFANAIRQGINPYSLNAFPEDMYVYGMLYPLMISPWMRLVSSTILIPRWVDLAFLCLTIGILIAFFHWKKVSFPSSLIGICIFLNAVCLVFKINGARADIPALFFSLLGAYFVLTKAGSCRRLFLAALCGICCLLIKQYFLIPIGLLLAYIFLFQSKKDGITFFIFLSLAFISVFVPIRLFLPLYWRYTILHHVVISSREFNHLLPQLRIFFTWFGGICFIFLCQLIVGILRQRKNGVARWKINLTKWETPLVDGVPLDFFGWGVFGSFAILIFYLGQNPGNSHTYFLELPLPYLLLGAICFIDQNIHSVLQRIPALILSITCIFPLGSAYQTDFTHYSQAYIQLESRMDQCRQIYGAPILTPFLLQRGAAIIFDNGQSEYGYTIISSRNGFFQKLLGGNDGQLENRWNLWNQSLEEKIKSHAFDCIAVNSNIAEIGGVQLSDYYQPETEIGDILDWDVITYSIRVNITIWIPKE